MPPKKAKKSDKGDGDPGSLTPAEKMAKMQLEIETLQRELEFKEEIVQRLRFQNSELREKNRFLEIAVEHKDQDRKDVTADMNRQYQFMHNELLQKNQLLEAKLAEANQLLTDRHQLIEEMISKHNESISVKNSEIQDRDSKLDFLAHEFESMLHETLDKMTKKLEAVSMRWKEEVNLTDENQRRLADFNLARLQV